MEDENIRVRIIADVTIDFDVLVPMLRKDYERLDIQLDSSNKGVERRAKYEVLSRMSVGDLSDIVHVDHFDIQHFKSIDND